MLEQKVDLPGVLLKAGELLVKGLHGTAEALEWQVVKGHARRFSARHPPEEPEPETEKEQALTKLARELGTSPEELRESLEYLVDDLAEPEESVETLDLWRTMAELREAAAYCRDLTETLKDCLLLLLKKAPGETGRA